MLSKFRNSDIPAEVKTASLLIISYGSMVLVLALWYGITNNLYDIKEYIRPIVRFSGMLMIGGWLLSLDKKSWWFATLTCSFLLFLVVVSLGGFLFVEFASDDYELNIPYIGIRIMFPLYLLGHAVFILSKKTTRSYFR